MRQMEVTHLCGNQAGGVNGAGREVLVAWAAHGIAGGLVDGAQEALGAPGANSDRREL